MVLLLSLVDPLSNVIGLFKKCDNSVVLCSQHVYPSRHLLLSSYYGDSSIFKYLTRVSTFDIGFSSAVKLWQRKSAAWRHKWYLFLLVTGDTLKTFISRIIGLNLGFISTS